MRASLDTRPTKIYTYALPCGPDPSCAAIVERQFRLAADYYRALVEIEIERLRQYREARAKAFPTLGAAEERLRAADLALSLDTESEPLLEARTAARAEVRTIRRSIPRADLDAFNAGPATASDEWANAAGKRARNTYGPKGLGLAPGTYMRVEDRVKQAIKQCRPLDITWDGWDGSGVIGVHIQGGRTQMEIATTDTQIHIRREYAGPCLPRLRHRPSKMRGIEKFRIVAFKGPAGQWMRFKLVFDRGLPLDADIANAWISRWPAPRWRDSKPRYRYQLNLGVKAESFAFSPSHKEHTACGINFGWRKLGDATHSWNTRAGVQSITVPRIRFAYVVGSDGAHESLEIPIEVMGFFAQAEQLRSLRDQLRDQFHSWLVEWAATHAVELPPTFARWRSCNAHEDLARTIDHDFARAYDQQSRHLKEYEDGLRRKAVGRRDAFFRITANRLARLYSTIYFDDSDLAKLKEQDGPVLPKYQLQHVAPGEFRAAIKLMASNRGTSAVAVDAQDITRTCHVCGEFEEDRPPQLIATCANGHVVDQDRRAATNIMTRGASGPVPTETREPLAEAEAAE